jgi:SAM-dependent methyltransferase
MASTSASFNGPQFYDEIMGPVQFGPFAVELARLVPPGEQGPVLEVACGTGLVTRELRARLDPSVRLVATDLGKAMIDYARSTLADQAAIEWREADAMALPFEDASFALVACGFGIMFAPDRLAALKEFRRVLRPGGRLVASVWDRIENNPHAWANAMVIESMFPGDAELRFRTPYEMHDPAATRELLVTAGFREVRIDTRRLPITAVDPRQLATGQIRGTPRSALIEKRGVPVEIAIDKVAAALEQAGGNPYSGHAQALLIEARAG